MATWFSKKMAGIMEPCRGIEDELFPLRELMLRGDFPYVAHYPFSMIQSVKKERARLVLLEQLPHKRLYLFIQVMIIHFRLLECYVEFGSYRKVEKLFFFGKTNRC